MCSRAQILADLTSAPSEDAARMQISRYGQDAIPSCNAKPKHRAFDPINAAPGTLRVQCVRCVASRRVGALLAEGVPRDWLQWLQCAVATHGSA